MEENKEMLELMKELEKLNRRQLRTGRMQCLFSLIAALCCATVLLAVLYVLPQVNPLMDQLEEVVIQTQSVLTNLEKTTTQLASVDLGSMVADVDTLVGTGQQSLEQTMEKLDSIDTEKLNQAIDDLSAVVEPLAKFFNVFQK